LLLGLKQGTNRLTSPASIEADLKVLSEDRPDIIRQRVTILVALRRLSF
jgi:hypothetical protein